MYHTILIRGPNTFIDLYKNYTDDLTTWQYPITDTIFILNKSIRFRFHYLLTCFIAIILFCSSSGPAAYAPDAPQPCRLIVLPSYYSSVLYIPTFYHQSASSSM